MYLLISLRKYDIKAALIAPYMANARLHRTEGSPDQRSEISASLGGEKKPLKNLWK
jgi:hypothetical protein